MCTHRITQYTFRYGNYPHKHGYVFTQAGIEQFQVVMDDTNNSSEDVEANRLNGKIVLVPTRAVEFIAIDFIVTNSGVSFE